MISVKSVAQTKKKKKIMKEKKMLEETKEKETYGKTGTDRGGLTEELRERERERERERDWSFILKDNDFKQESSLTLCACLC